ncbi:MAG: Arc family DNA-binding protein [Magnetococcales bacterium]|nr:Arc family DNA-binding protein [Magnetococcales bacterium]
MARTDPQFKLRLSAELKGDIEAAAKGNNRSMNAEIIFRLEKSFEEGFMDGGEVLEETVIAAPQTPEPTPAECALDKEDLDQIKQAILEGVTQEMKQQGIAAQQAITALKQDQQAALHALNEKLQSPPPSPEPVQSASTVLDASDLATITQLLRERFSEELKSHRKEAMAILKKLQPPPPPPSDLLEKSDLKKIRKVIQSTFDQEIGLRRSEELDVLRDLRQFSFYTRVLVDHMDPQVTESIRKKLGAD